MTIYLLQKLPWRLPGIVGRSVEEEIVPLVHLSKQCEKDSDAHNGIMVVVIELRIPTSNSYNFSCIASTFITTSLIMCSLPDIYHLMLSRALRNCIK